MEEKTDLHLVDVVLEVAQNEDGDKVLLAVGAAPDVARHGDDGPRVYFEARFAADAACRAGGEVLAVLEGAAGGFEAACFV